MEGGRDEKGAEGYGGRKRQVREMKGKIIMEK